MAVDLIESVRSTDPASIAFCRTKRTCKGISLEPNAAKGGKEADVEREYRLEVRLNKVELDPLRKDIQRTGLTQSKYLRALIMKRPIHEKLPIDYYRMLTELSRIGNNLNQIARSANQHPELPPDAVEALEIMKALYREMLSCTRYTHVEKASDR